MSLKLFNTLTGKKEVFALINPPNVGLYTCGPTVYNYAHIGNLRAYVFADILRRTLEYNGYAVKQVLNITDVGQLTSDADEGEDKMVKGLRREEKPLTQEAMGELGEFYTQALVEDLRSLNIELPHEMPRASKHISEDIELVQKLEEKGTAYKTNDGIYFDTAKFPEYGTRGGFKLGDLKEGARVAVNVEKKNPRDFALWKFSSGEIGFPSPWGKGFPGWHIECSAMSRKYLGQPFDIHTGGIDHIPVHHQNEIAQSEAAYGVPLANYWMHSEFLNMPEGKMAKSGENFITLQTLKDKGIHPLAYRYYFLQAHYRSPINFSWEALQAAQNAYMRILLGVAKIVKSSKEKQDSVFEEKLRELMNDDLDTPVAVAYLNQILRGETAPVGISLIRCFDAVLGLNLIPEGTKLIEEMNAIPEDIKKLASAREDARLQKDFTKADALRAKIHSAGFEVMDTDSGPIISKRNQRLSSS